ncbi:MAG: hypothetical protein RLZZ400_456 [Actinomycetota bacterium]
MTSINLAKARRATLADRWVSFNSRPVEITFLYLLTRLSRMLRVPGIGIIVSDARIMRAILMDGEHFSKTAEGGTSDLWDPVLEGPGLLNMSGPTHLDLKRKLAPLFNAKYLEDAIGEAVTGETQRLRARLLSGEPVDIVRSIEVTAARVICTLSGYDLENTEESEVLKQLENARGLLRFVKLGTKKLSEEHAALGRSELSQLHAKIHEAYDADRQGTIPHALKGFGLSKRETTAVITALVIAGTETVLSHLPRFTALLIRSDYLDSLKPDQDFSEVIEEGLRVTVPTPVMLRGIEKSTVVEGRKVVPGDRMMLVTTLACARLGDFNPTRQMPKEYRHLWFGAGVHMCIGLPLATLEIQKYLEMLVEVNQQKKLSLTKSRIRRGHLTAGYRELVIACKPS